MKVLLVDDDVDLLDVTAYALRREGFRLATAADGAAGLRRWQEDQPDVVVLDVGLPRLGGLDVCREIRAAGSTPIIMLTGHTTEDEIVRGFRAGADDYVTKPFSPRVLALRIRAVARRGSGTTEDEPEELAVGPFVLEREAHQVRVTGQSPVQLTPTEFRLFWALATSAGRLVSLNRLVELAWGYEEGDPSLLKTHICHLRTKLKLRASGPGVIDSVPRVGYRFVPTTA